MAEDDELESDFLTGYTLSFYFNLKSKDPNKHFKLAYILTILKARI